MPRKGTGRSRIGRSGKGVRRPRYRRHHRRRYGVPATRPYVGFPKERVVKMRYVHLQTFSASTGFSQVLNIGANDVYDPDHTGGGHQPLGFDQWSQFYNHYVVLGSKINMQMTSGNNNNNSDGAIMYCYLTDDVSIGSSVQALMEQGKAHYAVIPGNLQTQRPISIKNTYSAKKFFNVKDVKDNLDRLGAPVTASPTEAAEFCMGFSNLPGGVTFGGNWSVVVTIDYIVMFSEPKQLPQS